MRAIVCAAALFTLAQPAAAQGHTGVYAVQGSEPHLGAYAGRVELRWQGNAYALVREVDELKKDGETLRSRVEDDQPASAELDRLLARAVKIQSSVKGRQLPTASTAWTQMSTHLQGLAGAFGTTWAP